MAWYGAHGQQTYYEDTGRADPVVLLPGWGGSLTELNQTARRGTGCWRARELAASAGALVCDHADPGS